MKRSQLKIGQKVLVIPIHANEDKPAPKPKQMYVQELNKGLCAGLSYARYKPRSIYAILYSVIRPFPEKVKPGTTIVKLEFQVDNEKFEQFAEWLQGIRKYIKK